MSGTIGFKIGKMTNGNMVNCGAIGCDTGFEIGTADGCHLEGNIAISAEAYQKLEETYQFILSNKSTVIAESSEKSYQEILDAVKALSSSSTFDIIEKLTSLGANALSIWPTLEGLINSCIGLIK